MTPATTPRILLAVTFYNGRDFARRTLESVARLDLTGFDLDVLVLDDCSPEPGFSDYLGELAREFGATYYRSPRNLGIPRNVNLGLATAQKLAYDYVIISNSDVIYSENAVKVLFDVISSSPSAASATAWSTNVDPYSLPNGTEMYIETQEVADLIGDALSHRFGSEALRIPAGISFAMIIPVAVLPVVGLMDPVFGRGYGEESDWSARATNAGYDHLLAKGSFVYHAGRGSTLAAGVVSQTDIADWSNQHIVNHRSPMFRWSVDGFLRSHVLEEAQIAAAQALVVAAASRWGYVVIDGTRDWEDADPKVVSVAIRSQANEMCTATWCGFTVEIDTDTIDVLGAIREYFGGAEPISTNIPAATWEGAEEFGYPLGV
ncbi:glycosyltransferase [Microbacterium enclense]|uniref:glycosyltransferase family 2 protein n=1 Tax=Microbacterium enclense TaxID=993073 RepID=UPI00203B22B6|nr:glycosyltransferase [Microbacterium enclense]MCM3613801.1 glycosyltransferase [Microbacterium enclense]